VFLTAKILFFPLFCRDIKGKEWGDVFPGQTGKFNGFFVVDFFVKKI
jgi:hypothetical protein